MAKQRTPEEEWQTVLVDGHAPIVRMRRVWRVVPSPPRCKLCNNPFEGFGGRIAAMGGFRRSRKNPNLCTRCCDSLPPGGAEIDVAILFADVRGSTGLGERLGATDLAGLLNRFYFAATEALIKHDAVIDKLTGDGVMALFVPGIAGPGYRDKATDAGLELLAAVGYGSPEGPWIEVGAGVCAGTAFVGNVGGDIVDFTALGDPVNLAARLESEAAGGELVVAGDGPDARTFSVRGREEPVTARVLKA
jgi:adenylate cyclase